jgi:hypothetical protein
MDEISPVPQQEHDNRTHGSYRNNPVGYEHTHGISDECGNDTYKHIQSDQYSFLCRM